MHYINVNEAESKEVVPGYHGVFIHSQTMTTAYWDIVAGNSLSEHKHKHEQILHLIEGEFELTLKGETRKLYSGAVVVIPSNQPHSGKAITHCKLIDVFHPVREDFIF